jgi:hypothetical protein
MTFLVVNQGIIKSIGILTMVIHPGTKLDVDKLRDCFGQEVKWMLAICKQLRQSLRCIWTAYTTFHTLCHKKKIHIVCQKGINEFQMLDVGLTVVEIIKLCYKVPC